MKHRSCDRVHRLLHLIRPSSIACSIFLRRLKTYKPRGCDRVPSSLLHLPKHFPSPVFLTGNEKTLLIFGKWYSLNCEFFVGLGIIIISKSVAFLRWQILRRT
ncbi:hypothetical protein NE237_026070 [Protea cynaroides]|uniref:Uncharacterized protein n=1 Tax=Protea cynaroides TaxID=273540 RepID=A0A9Q0H881_9MAGN|nr:hypothetical protein NE237_026070 [Protea cynaroides]